jgi:hypothetical protein
MKYFLLLLMLFNSSFAGFVKLNNVTTDVPSDLQDDPLDDLFYAPTLSQLKSIQQQAAKSHASKKDKRKSNRAAKREYKEKLKRLIGKGKLRRKCIKSFKHVVKKMNTASQKQIADYFYGEGCDIEHVLACGEAFPADNDKTSPNNKSQRESCFSFKSDIIWSSSEAKGLVAEFKGGGNIAEIAKLIKLESSGTCNALPTKKGCYGIFINESTKEKCYVNSPINNIPKVTLEKNGFKIKKKDFIVHLFYCIDDKKFPSNQVFLGYCQMDNIKKDWVKDCIKDTSSEAKSVFTSWKNHFGKL